MIYYPGVGSSAASEQDIIDTTVISSSQGDGNILIAIITAIDVLFFLLETLAKSLAPLVVDGGTKRYILYIYIHKSTI